MLKAFREHWFGIVLSMMVLVCALFSLIVAAAPHRDAKMRGFAPCTYTMAVELGQSDKKVTAFEVMKIIGRGFFCYAQVISEGAKLYMAGKQKTPWENYLFEPVEDTAEFEGEDSEPFSEELLKANLLDEEREDLFDNVEIKENEDDGN